MESQKRKIEVFTAGCPLCKPVLDMVKTMACSSCEVIVYNLADPCESKVCHQKMENYGVMTLPAVAVNGKLLACCQGTGVTEAQLINAGIGTLN